MDLGKGLNHDPKVKLTTLVHFLQDHGLCARTLTPVGQEIADDFALLSTDLTERGLAFMRQGYQKWVKFVDRGGDPADTAILLRELGKLD